MNPMTKETEGLSATSDAGRVRRGQYQCTKNVRNAVRAIVAATVLSPA